MGSDSAYFSQPGAFVSGACADEDQYRHKRKGINLFNLDYRLKEIASLLNLPHLHEAISRLAKTGL